MTELINLMSVLNHISWSINFLSL